MQNQHCVPDLAWISPPGSTTVTDTPPKPFLLKMASGQEITKYALHHWRFCMKKFTGNKCYNFYTKTAWKSEKYWQKRPHTEKSWCSRQTRQQTRQWVVDIKMRYKWRVSRECSWCNDGKRVPRPLPELPGPWLDYIWWYKLCSALVGLFLLPRPPLATQPPATATLDTCS